VIDPRVLGNRERNQRRGRHFPASRGKRQDICRKRRQGGGKKKREKKTKGDIFSLQSKDDRITAKGNQGKGIKPASLDRIRRSAKGEGKSHGG